jgi:cytochrome c oxidase subunit 1
VFTGGADADAHEPEHGEAHGIHMPSPSYFPILASLGLPLMAYGVIYNLVLIPVGAAIVLFGLFGWVLEPAAEE